VKMAIPVHKHVIALDVGGTSVKSALVASGGRIVSRPLVTSIDSTAGAETILATCVAVISHHLQENAPGMAGVGGVAIGFPGPFDYEAGISQITGVAKYEAIYGLNLRRVLQARLGRALPIRFRNDAEAAIVGEAHYGAGRPYRRLIGVTLGTGCGSAFLIDGAAVTTGRGVPPNGWLYPISFYGQPADEVFSIRGLTARLQMAGVPVSDLQSVAEAARHDSDPTAREVFAGFGADLGYFLLPFTRDFQAAAVLILGGIGRAFDLFGKALSQILPIPALPGQLQPHEASLLGAAELFFDERT
jgi:glucokinase